jgi:large subunit ribosomal protein L28
MAKRCELTGKDIQFGNNVSHSKRKTRRKFLPNLQNSIFTSEYIGKVSVKITISTIRTIEKKGGIDNFLVYTNPVKLSTQAIALRKRIRDRLKKLNKLEEFLSYKYDSEKKTVKKVSLRKEKLKAKAAAAEKKA